MEIINKFVDYHKYCKSCKYSEIKETDEPCNTCLTNYINQNSKKPIFYKEKKDAKKLKK